jgi:post-segregation antitoxin (ccd killing protein)
MTKRTKRTTIYLEPDLYKALRLKSIAVSKSVSELVNEAIKESLKMARGDFPKDWISLKPYYK